MALTQSSTGELYGLDDFSTPPFDVLSTDWTELNATAAIESGELSLQASGGGTSGTVISNASYSNNVVICAKVRTISAGATFMLYWHRADGNNYYRLEVQGTGAAVTAIIYKVLAGAPSTPDSASITWAAGTDYNVKVAHNLTTGAISIWLDGALVLEAVDTALSSGNVLLRFYHATVNTAHGHVDNVSISSSNTVTCSGLPTGWDLVAGTKTAVAASGTATVDLDNLMLPSVSLYVKNSDDATKWSWGETWGGDIYALTQGRVIELYETDLSYLKDLTALNVEWSVDRQRPVRRAASFSVPITHLADLQPLGRQVKIYDDATLVFWGYMDSLQAEAGRYTLGVQCRDKTKRLKSGRFATDTTYEDLAAKETVDLYSTATASTALAIGDPIQKYGLIYQHTLSATVLGVATDVTEDATLVPATVTDPKQRIVQGSDFSITYSADGLTLLSYTAYIDMRVTENVGDIHVTTGGTLGTVYVSTDGTTWVAFVAGSFRFIKFAITAASGPITCSVVIDSGAAYPATNVAVDNGNSWRPTAADTDRYITVTLLATVTVTNEPVGTGDGATTGFNLDWPPITPNSQALTVDAVAQTEGVDYSIVDATGAITFLAGHIPADAAAIVATTYTFPTLGWNVLRLRWGVNNLDRTTRYIYSLYRSADNVNWTTIGTGYEATSSQLVEHLVTLTTDRYIKIRVTGASAPVALRYVEAKYVLTTAVALSEVIQAIATAGGETLFRITATRHWTEPVTFTAGTERWAAMQELAESMGWDLYYAVDGYLVFAPPDLDVTDPATPTYEALFDLSAEWSDADICNQVIGVCTLESGDLRSVQEDDNAFSATSTVRLGERTSPVQHFPLADTQQRLDASTLRYLQDVSRQRVRVSFTMEGTPDFEAGDIVHLHESITGIDGYFTLESFNVSDDPGGGGYVFHASVVQEVV